MKSCSSSFVKEKNDVVVVSMFRSESVRQPYGMGISLLKIYKLTTNEYINKHNLVLIIKHCCNEQSGQLMGAFMHSCMNTS